MSHPTPAPTVAYLKQVFEGRVRELVRHRRRPQRPGGFDDSEWPLVCVTLESNADDAFAAAFDAISGAHLRGRFVLLVDQRALPTLTSAQRHQIAAARAVDEAHFPGVQRARAIVVADEAQRRAQMAVRWLQPSRYPVEVFTKREDAVAWCCARLAL